jgi:ABC-type uncharacterized transport system substrate-binding protein
MHRRAMRRTAQPLGFAAILAMLSAPAVAHPHIFADARLEIETDASGNIAELRNVWRFDEVFSSSVVIDFDTNKNATMDPDELHQVAKIVTDSLADFNYFASITDNGKDIKVNRPTAMVANYDDGQLLLVFAVAPSQPVKLEGNVKVGIYDPTMYTAIDFMKDDDLVVTGPEAGKCESKVVRPDPDEVIAENQASLTDAFFNDPSGTDLSKLFATRLELDCK